MVSTDKYDMSAEVKRVSILGSTGSIGTQTLDVIESHPDRFRAKILTAGNNWELLARQAKRHRPSLVVISNDDHYPALKEALAGTGIETASGPEAIKEAATRYDDDIVVGALVGYAGLIPTLAAIRKGKDVALANKETLVAGGEIMTKAALESGARILPVDSEHSAIFQCLQGEAKEKVDRLILTASGGPFLNTPASELPYVTPADALRHPNWDMGAKVTIDSASMMNKGFEMIEARWLFDIQPDRIDILVHPQSVVHSMVEFIDGSVKAQLAVPDMRMPIRYALGYPERLSAAGNKLSLAGRSLTFEMPDMERFPLLGMAYEAIRAGGTVPATLNAANEIGVRAFLEGKIRFTDMPRLCALTLDRLPRTEISDIHDIMEAHEKATAISRELLNALTVH